MIAMNLGMVRGLLTLTLLLAFLGLVTWLVLNGKRSTYEAAARLPLENDDSHAESNRQ